MDGQQHFTSFSLVIHTIRWTGKEIVLDASGSSTAGVSPTCGKASQYVQRPLPASATRRALAR